MIGWFKGCIRDIIFDQQRIHYLTSNTHQDGVKSTNHNIQVGCHGDDVCGVNPCPPNSFCKDIWNAHTCPCLDGWEGRDCVNSVDDCVNNACQHGSTCIDGHLSYSCSCGYGYTGMLLKMEIFA